MGRGSYDIHIGGWLFLLGTTLADPRGTTTRFCERYQKAAAIGFCLFWVLAHLSIMLLLFLSLLDST